MAMLEVPDNGVMIDYVSTPQNERDLRRKLGRRSRSPQPKTLMMGFHPSTSFSRAEYKRVDEFLEVRRLHLATKDLGPVVYISLIRRDEGISRRRL